MGLEGSRQHLYNIRRFNGILSYLATDQIAQHGWAQRKIFNILEFSDGWKSQFWENLRIEYRPNIQMCSPKRANLPHFPPGGREQGGHCPQCPKLQGSLMATTGPILKI